MPKPSVTVSVKWPHECKSPKLKGAHRRGLPLRRSTIGRISGLEETAASLKGLGNALSGRERGSLRVALLGDRTKLERISL